MSGYRRITPRDRCQIEILKESGLSVRAIAKTLKYSASSISRELKKSDKKYVAELAQKESSRRAGARYTSQQKIKGDLEDLIRSKLYLDWSPEQITGWLCAELKIKISFKTIYTYIERDKKTGGKLTKHLRILRKQRADRKRPTWHSYRGRNDDRTPLKLRPKIVDKRKRLGDIERDTMFGKANGAMLLTMVDRTSRYVYLAFIKKKCSRLVHRATVRALKSEQIKTITNDNGTEFARHKETSRALNVKIYFSRAYAAWERGSNENTNGLIRQYFPRKKDLGEPTSKELQELAWKLNNRPRKCLGYRTPLEVHLRLKNKS